MCFVSIVLDYDLLYLNPKKLDILNDNFSIIKYRPVSDINAPIYFRESEISPGLYEEKWRELNSDELETLKYLIDDLRETNSEFSSGLDYLTFGNIIPYYFQHVRECKLKELGI